MYEPPIHLNTHWDVAGAIVVGAFIAFGWGGVLYFAVVVLVDVLMR